jgi:hypothetical protein
MGLWAPFRAWAHGAAQGPESSIIGPNRFTINPTGVAGQLQSAGVHASSTGQPCTGARTATPAIWDEESHDFKVNASTNLQRLEEGLNVTSEFGMAVTVHLDEGWLDDDEFQNLDKDRKEAAVPAFKLPPAMFVCPLYMRVKKDRSRKVGADGFGDV